jgi:2-oxoglutarate/2-oxoacid ferredoxin oxidoreductase subunit alpha
MAKVLMKGSEVLGEAAIQAGCKYFFGYPITPQNELLEYMAKRLPQVDGVFVQAESELAAINMVYGAASTGVRVMTSSSSPGISLMQEGISYLVGAQLPAVICNIMRGGPGLGTIQPAQSDYFQAVKGGGHGDYHLPVLAPASLQEIADLMVEAFDMADSYRSPVLLLGDGMLGQMMEPVEFVGQQAKQAPSKSWAASGSKGDGPARVVTSIFLDPVQMEKHNEHLVHKYKSMLENEIRYETYFTEDAEVVCVAYGTTARILKNVVQKARKQGLKIGLIRPISLWPFPQKPFEETILQAKAYLSVEMSTGQMVEDVRLAVQGRKPVHFYGRTGGMIPTQEDILLTIQQLLGGDKKNGQ